MSHLAIKPPHKSGVIKWAKENLFRSKLNTIVSIICLYLVVKFLIGVLDWGIINAIYSSDSSNCNGGSGACWGVIAEKYRFIIFGIYPAEEQWRPLIAMIWLVALISCSLHRAFWRFWLMPLWLFSLAGLASLMWGGVFGLTYVENTQWGGLPLTLILAVIGTVAAFPLGILLALGRTSKLPFFRIWCVAFIEIVRGVPLISVLFMASVMFPLFLPEGVTIDKLLRAQVGIILFSAAYLAEVFRGGLQAVPKGQYEAADAMGLTYWQTMSVVIMPQALRIVIPPTVNSFISMFKDTSLVLIIGLFDLLATAKVAIIDPIWREHYFEVYIFIAAIYFVFCYSMASYANNLEKVLSKDKQH
ncbi:amino acid ABC transporter permease [Marinomonas sp. 42_23_T18]|nr:amino acid ABC transporter permease [Marinomonas sp. 42_23_T18]